MSKRARSNTGIAIYGVKIQIFQPILLAIALFGSSPSWASPRVENIQPWLLTISEAMLRQLPVSTKVQHQTPTVKRMQSAATVTPKEVFTKISHNNSSSAPSASPTFVSQSPASPQVIQQGNQLSLNGRIYNATWRQWQQGQSVRTSISDAGLMQHLGVDLLSTRDLTRQPVQWFSDPAKAPLILASQLTGAYRYLDVSDFAKTEGWQLQAEGSQLKISTVPAGLKDIQQETQPWGSRIVIDLDRSTPWQISDRLTEGVITLDASADSSLIDRFKPPLPQPPQPTQSPQPKPPQPTPDPEDINSSPAVKPSNKPVLRVESGQNQTTIRIQIPEGKRIQAYSIPSPNRLVIDIRSDVLVEKEILWAPGIRWRQQYVNLGESRFPVVWLEIDPKANRMSFRPIWGNPGTQTGITPLIQMAQLWQASAAINAGFFNRNNQLPLGAIRRDGRWFSGPILNRGAIAWNDSGQFKIGRLTLQETLTTTGTDLPILFLNSAYVQPGISRYTPEWGLTYTPLSDNEVLVVVQKNQVTGQFPGGKIGQTAFPIPSDGYLLTLRGNGTSAASFLGVGTQISIGQTTTPADFATYPQILAAGPLLLLNRQIVLDGKAEQFSEAFSKQLAVRSCVATTASGTLIFAAIHHRVGGRGPSLAEAAQIMQQMGAIDALNFDGGSSTGLYLGGQLLDRSPSTAARVHNALGLFLTPLP